MIIFEKSVENARAESQSPHPTNAPVHIPEHLIRKDKPTLPELSELDVVRHYHNLSQKNFAIDGQFYPLGSCTMKYNPKGVQKVAAHPHLKDAHPNTPSQYSQGYLSCLYELQDYLKAVTGMHGVSLTPMAGAQGELAGVMMIKQYHHQRGDTARIEMLVPDSAHGTNPASACMCGFKIREIPTGPSGDLDMQALKEALSEKTAGIMLTNPSTLGLFERDILTISKWVHDAGGLLYYDGANLNAILSQARPGDMGFDVMHMNMHKTFATPHGGGGPGSGPVAVSERLEPYLPTPIVGFNEANHEYEWLSKKDRPLSIGQMSAFMGNAAILFRAWAYIRLLGREGLRKVSTFATLNANYIKVELERRGIESAYPDRMGSHEFIITFKSIKKEFSVTAMDVAKRLLDYRIHAPTTYFPLGVPECFLIEPTETESKRELDNFIEVLEKIYHEAQTNPEKVKTAPHSLPITRVDEVKAARELKVTWKPTSEKEESTCHA